MAMNQNVKKWLMLSILCLAGGTIYTFPFLRFSYYEPLKEALGLTHTQLGVIQSCYGIIATLGYIPGGMLADRFSPTKTDLPSPGGNRPERYFIF